MTTLPPNKRFAVFDIDGTLYRWQLFHDLVEELAVSGTLPATHYETLSLVWNQWRGGELKWRNYEDTVVELLIDFLPRISPSAFDAASDKVVAQSGHRVHHFPRALLRDLKRQGYAIIAISGSQQELLDKFCARHGFDLAIGAVYERKGDSFTGRVIRQTIGRKHQLLQELIQEYDLDTRGSVAIGDSDGDGRILSLVDRPIAFNPSDGLFMQAKKERWQIVIERKNIAYLLEKTGETLVLADTIVY